ncbi:hypothetical protein SAMN05428944_3721 [Streptomyces sp. 1222.5]|uniref:hypothetical protein n=1 Tax=unclassified Streptomyces TaxID=2593676 RepID=UPI00089D8E00|nr:MULTISPECIES: hypothetical protein [unclassified Streptomyces]PKW09128.1 hypothetical protein BX260_4373 [Streptomyces sp. 5112.2]SEC43837.1 hypothetical protein SAMN05428944_3721 [Streptomyces sp. 1222.5]
MPWFKQSHAAAGWMAAAVLLTSGCALLGSSSADARGPGASYEQAYADHEPLHVVGYPSTGSLLVMQELVWDIADGKTAELRKLATSDSSDAVAQKTAENWIKGFGAGARGKVTGDFYNDGSERQVVVLYFHGTHQFKEFTVRLDGDAGKEDWRILMKSTDFKDATQAPSWAPKEPGGTGSTMKNNN